MGGRRRVRRGDSSGDHLWGPRHLSPLLKKAQNGAQDSQHYPPRERAGPGFCPLGGQFNQSVPGRNWPVQGESRRHPALWPAPARGWAFWAEDSDIRERDGERGLEPCWYRCPQPGAPALSLAGSRGGPVASRSSPTGWKVSDIYASTPHLSALAPTPALVSA